MKKFFLLEEGDDIKIGDEVLVHGNTGHIWSRLEKIPENATFYNKGTIARREIIDAGEKL